MSPHGSLGVREGQQNIGRLDIFRSHTGRSANDMAPALADRPTVRLTSVDDVAILVQIVQGKEQLESDLLHDVDRKGNSVGCSPEGDDGRSQDLSHDAPPQRTVRTLKVESLLQIQNVLEPWMIGFSRSELPQDGDLMLSVGGVVRDFDANVALGAGMSRLSNGFGSKDNFRNCAYR